MELALLGVRYHRDLLLLVVRGTKQLAYFRLFSSRLLETWRDHDWTRWGLEKPGGEGEEAKGGREEPRKEAACKKRDDKQSQNHKKKLYKKTQNKNT